MSILRKLKKNLSKGLMFINDINSKSNNGSNISSRGVVEGLTTGSIICEFDDHFHETKVENWEQKQVNGWINHVLPFGKRAVFMGALPIIDASNGEGLSECRFGDFVGVLDDVHEQVSLKRPLVLQLVVELGYLKELIKNEGYYDLQFGFCLCKLVSVWPVMDYTMLKQAVRVGMRTRAKVKLDEEDYYRYTTTLASYVYNYLSKEKLMVQLMTHLEQKFNSKYGGRKKDTQEILFKVKFILIDQIASNDPSTSMEDKMLQRKTKRFFSPIVSKIPFLKPEFGIFHVGLELDSKKLYIEWTTSSSVFFKEMDTVDPVLTVDLKPAKIKRRDIKKFSDGIATIIHRWNSTKTYNIISTNCQHFAIEICKSIGTKIETPDGAFKQFFDKMKKRGVSDLIFEPSQEFKKKFRLRKDSYHFKKHNELDVLCLDILKASKNKEQLEGTPEWKLLKSFDEIFWIRYFNEKDVEQGEQTISSRGSFNGNCQISDMICPFINHKDQESEIYKKIVKKSEEYNKLYQEKWYNHYLEESIEADFQKSFKCALKDVRKSRKLTTQPLDSDSD